MVNTVLSSMTVGMAAGDDATSLLQVFAAVRQHSQGQRIVAAVAQESNTICVEAAAGDVAPVAGSFTAKMSQEAVEVAVGSVAAEAGSFCVPKANVLLMQRTFGLNTAGDFEAALGAKKKKQKQTTTTTTVGFDDFNFAGDLGKSVMVQQCPDKKAGLVQTMDATVALKRRRNRSQLEREADEKRVCECRSFLRSSVDQMWNKEVFDIVNNKKVELLQRHFDTALSTKKKKKKVKTTTTTTTTTSETQVAMTEACTSARKIPVELFGNYGMFDKVPLPRWAIVAKLLNDPDIAVLFKAANITEGWQHCNQDWVVHGACGKFLTRPTPTGYSQPTPTGYSQTGARCKVEAGQPDNSLSLEFTAETLEECKDACDMNDKCVAFDFEPATKECELVKAVDLKASVADGVADGGDGRCNADSCCYSKALPAPTGYSPTGARCKVEAGQPDNSLGAKITAETLEKCKAACDENNECVAFEFEPATKECELVKAVDLKASVADGVADGGDGRCNADSCCYGKCDGQDDDEKARELAQKGFPTVRDCAHLVDLCTKEGADAWLTHMGNPKDPEDTSQMMMTTCPQTCCKAYWSPDAEAKKAIKNVAVAERKAAANNPE